MSDNHDGVITDLEPDILECEVKWALESITTNKASAGDGTPVELFQILKDEFPRSKGAQYATREERRNNSRENEETEPRQKQHPVVDVTGDGSKVQCCKEQYCIETWNCRSMNQGKLEVVKQEMARVNIDILGISKLKWTGIGEFNSDDQCIYYLARIP